MNENWPRQCIIWFFCCCLHLLLIPGLLGLLGFGFWLLILKKTLKAESDEKPGSSQEGRQIKLEVHPVHILAETSVNKH